MKKKTVAALLCIMCIFVVGCNSNNVSRGDSKAYETVIVDGSTYYMKKGQYKGEYFYYNFESVDARNIEGFEPDDKFARYIAIESDENKIIDITSEEFLKLEQGVVYDFEEYEEFCKKYFVKQKYTEEDKNYIVVSSCDLHTWLEFEPIEIEYDDNSGVINYYYYEKYNYSEETNKGIICVIPTDIEAGTNVNMKMCLTKDAIENIKNSQYDDVGPDPLKPVIYLYPEEDNTKVEVSLETENAELTCTYPKYNDGWSVIADKDGLIKANGKEYNYLYWEGESEKRANIDNGFCVKGSDTEEFLEEKLEELGLKRREANEFIVYWLPLMEQNEYNVISFDTKEYENTFKLHVNPAPDTVIRVFMTWYATDEAVDIKPQNIETPVREGFTVIEWGGAQIGGKVR